MSLYALYIYSFKNGQIFLLHFFIICWATDTFAYLVGTFYGKNKLCEKISPKKTFEGLWGGLLGGIIFGCLGEIFLNINFYHLIAVSLFTSVFCVLGDLFESLIKRKFNVKDSGILIPGHGGILDRIDGLLFALPIYYFLIKLSL
jgi:phosphatidate cytidylyltransferase